MYKYKHFIPENIAPKGAKRIVVYDGDGNKVCEIPLGRMTHPIREKLYSFGSVADIHLWNIEPSWKANAKFDNALSYFENQGCAFCSVGGDLTQTGFYKRTVESDANTTYFDESQLVKYKKICDKHTIDIYEIAGNHESYYGMTITDNLDKWNTYTGKNVLAYTISQGNDLFIFVGQPKVTTPPISDEDLQWLYETLESNRNKRCFIFVHPHISSGNPLGAYTSNNYFAGWGTKTTAFTNLLKHYKNTILFHGHSHFMFECQEFDESANYTDKDGFRSIHIPSLSRPCALIDGVRTYQDTDSQGYIVDVYDDCIVLNGMDFINNSPVPLGTYKIDTTLQTIEANTFTDSTGTITTLNG
jgi:hypothetical protein